MYSLFISNAMAQDTAAAAQPNAFFNMIPLVLVFIIFYVFVLLPQKKRTQQEMAYNKALEKGAEVYTKSGILGKIYGLTDKVVTLELEGGVKMKVLRSQIGGSSKQILEPKPEKK